MRSVATRCDGMSWHDCANRCGTWLFDLQTGNHLFVIFGSFLLFSVGDLDRLEAKHKYEHNV